TDTRIVIDEKRDVIAGRFAGGEIAEAERQSGRAAVVRVEAVTPLVLHDVADLAGVRADEVSAAAREDAALEEVERGAVPERVADVVDVDLHRDGGVEK